MLVGIDYRFQVFDTKTGHRIESPRDQKLNWQAQYHPVEKQILVNGPGAFLNLYDANSLTLINSIETPFVRTNRTRLTSDGSTLVIAGTNNANKQSLEIRTFPRLQPIGTPIETAPRRSITEIALSPNDNWFVLRRPAGVLDFGRIRNAKIDGSITCPQKPIHQLSFLDADRVLVIAGDAKLFLIDLPTRAVTSIGSAQIKSNLFALSSSPPRLFSGSKTRGNTVLTAWDLSPIAETMRRSSQGDETLLAMREAVKKSPDDPRKHIDLGTLLCLKHNQWNEGISHLTFSSDAMLQNVASADKALSGKRQPAGALALIELGDRWQSYGKENANKNLHEIAIASALYWYELAKEHSTGLTSLRAQAKAKALKTVVKTRRLPAPQRNHP